MDEVLIYGLIGFLSLLIVWLYVRGVNKKSEIVSQKVSIAQKEGRFEPLSLHPFIDLNTCIGSGACIKACPEQDVLGIVSGKATVINATSCIGHGACFHACPVEAISLRIGTEKRGVELPHINQNFETNVPGLFIAGELGGMGLIKNAMEQGKQAVQNLQKTLNEVPKLANDLVIIGAGPAGIGGGLMAKKLGLSFEILEQDSLGGTVFTFPREKVVMTQPIDLPLYGKLKLFNTSKKELLAVWEKIFGEHKIVVRQNHKVSRIVPLEKGGFKVQTTNDQVFETRKVLLAIGRRGTPRKLGVKGENLEKVAYRLVDAENISGKKILVVGGGDSAVESALLLMAKNKVTLSYRKEAFARIKKGNHNKINAAMEAGKLVVLFASEVAEIKLNTVILSLSGDETLEIKNDLVYVFIGGELPNEFLKNSGIEITKRFGQILKKY